MIRYIYIIAILLIFIFSNCNSGLKQEKKIVEGKEYTGWWVYGEGQHLFKDEMTLKEWELIFPHENKEELIALYLAVCEMEYFPMECIMMGDLQEDTLWVVDFEITYVQGCGEE